MILVSVLRRYLFLDLSVVLGLFFANVSLSFQPLSLEVFSFSFLLAFYIQSPFSTKERGLKGNF